METLKMALEISGIILQAAQVVVLTAAAVKLASTSSGRKVKSNDHHQGSTSQGGLEAGRTGDEIGCKAEHAAKA